MIFPILLSPSIAHSNGSGTLLKLISLGSITNAEAAKAKGINSTGDRLTVSFPVSPSSAIVHAALKSSHLSSDSAIASQRVSLSNKAVPCVSKRGLGGSQQKMSSTVRV